MKFQWYVIDTKLRTVEGTNDVDALQSLVQDDRYILLTAQHGRYFNGSSSDVDVHELCTSEDNEDDEDEDDENSNCL